LWLLAQGCGLARIGLAEACVVMGCLGIGILVPSGPGYFGTYQLSVYMALAMFVPAAEVVSRGSAFVFVAYCCQLLVHAIGAALGVLLLRVAAGQPVGEASTRPNGNDLASSQQPGASGG